MRLVALYWMHGVEGAWHAFLELNDHSYLAFVQMPQIEKIERQLGVTHAGSGAGASAGGTMQHVALNVDTPGQLLALRDRIRSRGVTVVGPIHHGLCDSIYFAGPEDLSLEIATSERAIDGRAWIDPEVVALAGIAPAELERFRSPAPFADRGGALAQPPLDKSKPYMRGWPPGHLRADRADARRRVHVAHERDGAAGPRVTFALLGPLFVYARRAGAAPGAARPLDDGLRARRDRAGRFATGSTACACSSRRSALYAAACGLGLIPWDFFYLHRWEMAAGACVLGLDLHARDRAARAGAGGPPGGSLPRAPRESRSGAAVVSTRRCSSISSAP